MQGAIRFAVAKRIMGVKYTDKLSAKANQNNRCRLYAYKIFINNGLGFASVEGNEYFYKNIARKPIGGF